MQSNELDDLINELDDFIQKPEQVVSIQQPTKKKCVIPIIGNSQRACQNLRCTKCDIKVTCHQGKKWNQDTTYLVLRNYFNNPAMLSKYQIETQNCNAYNCQCLSIDSCQECPKQWVCGGHII